MKKSYFVGCLFALLGLVMVSCDNDDISGEELKPFKEALSKMYPSECMDCVGWEKENGYYVAELFLASPASDVEVWFDKNANWCMTETDYGMNYQPLTNTYRKEFLAVESMIGGKRIDDVSVFKHKNGSVVIEIECKISKDQELTFVFKDGEYMPNAKCDITPDSPIWN